MYTTVCASTDHQILTEYRSSDTNRKCYEIHDEELNFFNPT